MKDDLQVVSTDHCPFDFHGQKELGRGDFRKVPNGLPGVEDRVDLMHDGGVVGGRISKERWVEIISTAPAKLFGMYPRKGSISVGADADLVVYDPNRKRTISAKSHHMDVDYSCYEGRQVQGASDVVLSRGSVIVRDGTFTGRKGHGRFVKRSTADHAGDLREAMSPIEVCASATSTSRRPTGADSPRSTRTCSAASWSPPERDIRGARLDAATGLRDAHLTGAHLRLPGHGPDGPTIEIFSYDALEDHPGASVDRAGWGHVAFQVPDVPAAVDAVIAAGGGRLGDVITTGRPMAGR